MICAATEKPSPSPLKTHRPPNRWRTAAEKATCPGRTCASARSRRAGPLSGGGTGEPSSRWSGHRPWLIRCFSAIIVHHLSWLVQFGDARNRCTLFTARCCSFGFWPSRCSLTMLPAFQRPDERLRLGRIPFHAALDGADFAPVLVDDQSDRQSERLAVPSQGFEDVATRIGVSRQRLDAD